MKQTLYIHEIIHYVLIKNVINISETRTFYTYKKLVTFIKESYKAVLFFFFFFFFAEQSQYFITFQNARDVLVDNIKENSINN